MSSTISLGATAVVIDGGRILLTKREDFQVWCLPGGHTDPGESVAETAVREIREETGLAIALDRFVGIYSRIGSDPAIHLNVFAAHPVGGSLQPQADEVIDIGFFAPDDLPADLFWWHRPAIADALAGVRGAAYTITIDPARPVGSRTELYDLRDRMRDRFSRPQFYRWFFEDRPGNSIRRDI